MRPGRSPLRKVIALAIGGWAALILATAGCGPRADPTGPLHLVIDAGSSGTRLCLFAVERVCDSEKKACACSAPHAPVQAGSVCQAIPDVPGLADLAPQQAAATLETGLQRSLSPETRARLQGAVLLGTGGFRQIPADRRAAVVKALAARLERTVATLPADPEQPEALAAGDGLLSKASSAAVLSGADEGRLAWLAMREIERSPAHAILETGGASIQFATGAQGRLLESISLPIGMNAAFKRLQGDPGLPLCYPFGAPDGRTDFDGCRAAIQRSVFSDAASGSLAEAAATKPDGGPLYGLGSSWRAVFAGMERSEVSLAELLEFGRQVCADRKLTEQERTSKYLKRRCYLYAYQSVLLEQTGFASIRQGSESWPRGAAISSEYFPGCGGP